ncbi:Hpt domain-containing protein [Luteibacter sp. 329MFSha]|nr:Hpt domain-containing protein [Luteibacter sp. 329MFSha]
MNDTERYMPEEALSVIDPVVRARILVADDDASTRQFLSAALRTQGYLASVAQDGAEACALARSERFDALLLDCRMPGGGAVEVLAALRGDPSAASRDAVALATSAEMPATLRVALADAGFVGVVEKPCRIASLLETLAATLGVDRDLRVLDDDASLKATGDAGTMAALRGLLRGELVELLATLDQRAYVPTGLVEELHRLRSACGFCGATRLGMQAKALQAHIENGHGIAPDALGRFRMEVEATLAALTP